jgi:hypothetical protein
MSPILLAITMLATSYAIWGLLQPARLYRFDCAVSLMFMAWVIPQMLIIETTEFQRYHDYTFAWAYILVCQILAYVGFLFGKFTLRKQLILNSIPYDFSLRKANFACAVIIIIGFFGFGLMAREAEGTGLTGEWSGIITFYYLIGQFILYGGALAWLFYLHKRNRISLIIFIMMLAVAIPVVLYLARRGILFQVGFAILAGAYLVRKFELTRTAAATGILIGFVILNTAGNIRAHIESDNGTLVSSITSGAAVSSVNIFEDNPAPEIKSALTDIEITRASGKFEPFVALWNTLVLQYVPAFIVGKDFKDSLRVDREAETTIQRFEMTGATRTGFAEAYTGYSYFGVFLYLLIGIYQGRMWVRAESGDIRSQYYYIIVMNYSLLTITESISRFLVTLPIIYGIGYLVFRYIEKLPRRQVRLFNRAVNVNSD